MTGSQSTCYTVSEDEMDKNKMDKNKVIAGIKVNRSEIARAVGVDLAHISRIFSGKATPGLSLAVKIAIHLGITVDDLCIMLGIKPDRLDSVG